MSGRPELIDYSSELSSYPIAKELYTVQTEMLHPRTGFTRLKEEDLGKSGSLAFYGTDTKKITININRDKRRSHPLTQTLSHEMTHAIDHLHGIGLESKIQMLADGLEHHDTMVVKKLVSEAFPEGMQAEYHRQANTKELFIQETGAYIFEGIFKDMTNDKSRDILSRFEAINRPGGTREPVERAIAQEIVAVAIGSISGAMVSYIESSRDAGLSLERASLFEKLATLNAVVQPAYERANKKLAEIDGGDRTVGADDPSRKRQMIEDGVGSRILEFRLSEIHSIIERISDNSIVPYQAA